ncbi:MAG: C69 family dipeptidase [Bacteroidales bacterium]|jgi:dipeptidase|nr:C69 family dipeptidase [Bacteroidales bacterium]MDD4385681.1 C69 family dipeptidase [Bacteroidales bacterium]MDY0197572.1 C69 family dipeptidase [Tenuifilaceae bacterium]
MKKTIRLLSFGLFLGFALVAPKVQACTNFLVTRGASVDGSTMITYSADSHYLYGELYHWAAASYAPGTLLKIYEWDTGKYLGVIPQIEKTYSVIGNINEHQVAIGETTYGGRDELVDTTGIIDYGSLIYITLQRAKTAREAIKIMAELVAEHGYASSGESFSIADANEVWIMELIGKGTDLKTDRKTKKIYNANKGAVWVAMLIPDGYVSGHANHARITKFPKEEESKKAISSNNLDKIFNPEVEVVYSQDVVSFARNKGYYKGNGNDFSFSDIYAPVDFGAARFCEIRVWSFFKDIDKSMWNHFEYAKGLDLNNRMPLWVKPDRKLSAQDLMNFMRDHLENTELDMSKDPGAGPHGLPYRWRPLTWEYDGKTYVNERATATQQTGFSFVTQSRNWLPDPIGGIIWFSVDDASTTVYTPIYCGINEIPHSFAQGNGDLLNYSADAAFWVFNKVSNFAYLRYDVMSTDIIKVQKEMENYYASITPLVDKKAQELFEQDENSAINFITSFSVNTANSLVKQWQSLFEFLVVKYIDGNIKQEENGVFKWNEYNASPASVKNPQYPEWWKKHVIESTGNKLLVP